MPLLLIPSWAEQLLSIDCLSVAYRLPLMQICSAIMDMGPGPGPMPKKGAVPAAVGRPFWAMGPRPGPYPLWLRTWASSQGNKQEGINTYSAQEGINSKDNIIDI